MSVSCPDECFKIDMGCDCPPPPPDKPLPFMFILFNTDVVDSLPTQLFGTNYANPGTVGLYNGSTFLPTYTFKTWSGRNFPYAIPITIDPPPGFPGPGLTQATATMTVNTVGDVTITMTNVGAGYTIPSTAWTVVVNHTISEVFDTLYVKSPGSTVLQGMGAPVGRLSLPPAFGANLTLSSAKILPQLNGYITNTLGGGSPITVTGKWYKNGVQIGDSLQKVISTEGRHPWTHYCPAITFGNTEGLTYKFSCATEDLINFRGIVEYFVQYV